MLFGSIFDGFKKQEGKFLLLELGKSKSQLNKFVYRIYLWMFTFP